MNQNYKKLQSALLALAVISTMGAMGMEEGAGGAAQGPPGQVDPLTSSIQQSLDIILRLADEARWYSPLNQKTVYDDITTRLRQIEQRPNLSASHKDFIAYLRKRINRTSDARSAAGQGEYSVLVAEISEFFQYQRGLTNKTRRLTIDNFFARITKELEQKKLSEYEEMILRLKCEELKDFHLRGKDFHLRGDAAEEDLEETLKTICERTDRLARWSPTVSEKAAMLKEIDEIEATVKKLMDVPMTQRPKNNRELRLIMWAIKAQISDIREDLDQNIGTGE